MKKMLLVLVAVVAILLPITGANATPASTYPFTWAACKPIVWSYIPADTLASNQNQWRTVKAIRTATMHVQKMSGHVIREALPGETPNVLIKWTTTAPNVEAEAPLWANPEGTEIYYAEVHLNPELFPHKRSDQTMDMMHEFGHVLGLQHTDTPYELMSGTYGIRKMSGITADDFAAFAALPQCDISS